MKLLSVYKICPKVYFYELDNVIMLVPNKFSEEYFIIDGIAIQVLKLIDGKNDNKNIIDLITGENPSHKKAIAQDVLAFIKTLEKNNLILKKS
jgi:hypothetical protein